MDERYKTLIRRLEKIESVLETNAWIAEGIHRDIKRAELVVHEQLGGIKNDMRHPHWYENSMAIGAVRHHAQKLAELTKIRVQDVNSHYSFVKEVIEAIRDEIYEVEGIKRTPHHPLLPSRCDSSLAEEQKQLTKRNGYVYVLRQVNGIHYKIGHTNNPTKRKNTFNVKLPFPVEFDVLIKTDDRYSLERQLHQQFADKRVNGEWFALDVDDLEAIRGIA